MNLLAKSMKKTKIEFDCLDKIMFLMLSAKKILQEHKTFENLQNNLKSCYFWHKNCLF